MPPSSDLAFLGAEFCCTSGSGGTWHAIYHPPATTKRDGPNLTPGSFNLGENWMQARCTVHGSDLDLVPFRREDKDPVWTSVLRSEEVLQNGRTGKSGDLELELAWHRHQVFMSGTN
ncbi:RNA polymerase beta subunit [Anopheles sinensis]|uniref:RNA polymerase beta subunit n=1 Tax=Anopheles sinensis TaxID=74873 RepID=A0A084WT19_ANOSI|nr:RNA polymerase beta subunit [Anopheles sinensis]